jgi:hypothetical protein
MKRLIKKSEFVDSVQRGDAIYDIYKNPTDTEIGNAKKSGSNGGVRGVILDDGTLYIWTEDLLHAQVNGIVNNNDFRFSWSYDMNEWYIDCHRKYDLQEAINTIKQYKLNLSRIGDTSDSSLFSISNTTDNKNKELKGSEIFK